MNKKRIVCQQCKYYYVTWEGKRPHGCKAYGFKSLKIPALVVRQSSGIDCSLYENKFNKR